MEPHERQQIILERLGRVGHVRVSELIDEVSVSKMTIRRDLELLEREGLLKRMHGGATSVSPRGYEPPYALRSRVELDAKLAVARAAAALVGEGDSVIVDGGTTGLEIARALRGHGNLTVCTTSLRIAAELADDARIRLMIVGGTIRPGERSLSGELAESAFANLRFDAMFLTASGVSIADGVTEWNLDDARVKRAAIASAARIIVAADATKLDQTAFAKVCGIDRVDVLVTDERIPSELEGSLAERDVHVIAAPVDAPSSDGARRTP
jgi:DeoR/GlpR family transcriptional regulator of sugar metabolism